jgi:hypothetical protein
MLDLSTFRLGLVFGFVELVGRGALLESYLRLVSIEPDEFRASLRMGRFLSIRLTLYRGILTGADTELYLDVCRR